ncbi:MAG TPA: DUF6190 family protein [Candidatus Paceibacterota bacterium]|nr:DUF6190 family protein [Candidatus Paceibacterota bacterium]
MKITFDNSIHLGQFSINNEHIRIAAKNSQVSISAKPNTEYIGVETFNENTFSDNIIWGLEREPQDIFYKFMDIYHSLKNIDRIPLNSEDAQLALEISRKLNIDISNALTCAVAIRTKSDEIHSFYSEFQKQNVKDFLLTFNIKIKVFQSEKELVFAESNLEKYYQDSLTSFRQCRVDLVKQFHV